MRNLKDVAAETGVDLKTVRTVAAALSKQAKADPDMVTLRHPKLPAEQVVKVDRRRAGARFAAGWVEVEEPKREPVDKAADESKPPTKSESNEQPAAEPEKPKRPRRKSTEEQ